MFGHITHPQIVSLRITRIHNTYMLASAWGLVWEWLEKLAEYGLEDTAVKPRIRRDETFRSIYLVLYHLVQVIADAEQKKFAVLATSAGRLLAWCLEPSIHALFCFLQNILPAILNSQKMKQRIRNGCSIGPASKRCTSPSWTRSSSSFAYQIRSIQSRSCYS